MSQISRRIRQAAAGSASGTTLVRDVFSVDPYTGATSAVDVECEFKDDIVENILDDTISIIAGDISDANNLMRGQQQSEKNN